MFWHRNSAILLMGSALAVAAPVSLRTVELPWAAVG